MKSREIRNLLQLQSILLELTEDNISTSGTYIYDTVYSKSANGVRFIVNEIMRVVDIRPLETKKYAQLLKHLYDIPQDGENFFLLIPKFLKEQNKHDSTMLRFLRHCISMELMSVDTIFERISNLSNEDEVFIFIFFIDLIKLHNQEMYNRLKQTAIEKNSLKLLPSFREKSYDDIEANNFKLLTPLIENGWPYNSIRFHASIDDIDFISNCGLNNKLELDKKYINIFAVPLTDNATIIDFCAFYGSVKCFKYLLINKAKLSDNSVMLAFAGGNPEIIHICETNHLKMQKGLSYAIKYKRNDVFEWANMKFEQNQKTRNENFAAAAEYHNIDILLKLMQQPVDCNYKKIPESIVEFDSLDLIKLFRSKGCNFRSAACVNIAAKNKNTQIVEYLIKNHSNYKKKEQAKEDPLIIAINNNDHDTAKVLLEDGESPNKLNALHIACKCSDAAMVKLLLSYGASVNAPDNTDTKPIIIASFRGETEIVKALIESGAEYDTIPSTKELSPLTAAAKGGKLDTVKYLLSIGCNPNEASEKESLPLVIAKKANNTEVEKYLYTIVSNVIDSMVSVLFNDVKQKNFESVQNLVLKNTPLNRVDAEKRTVLHYAAATNREIIEFLIKKGADVDSRDADDMTPLHYAIVENNLGCIKALIENGANLNLLNNKGFTPLRLAVHNFNFEAVEYLLYKDADPNIEDLNKVTPLIDVASAEQSEDRTIMISILLRANSDAKKVDSTGHSALTVLLRHNPTIEEIDLLVSHGSPINSSTKKGIKTMYDAARLPPQIFAFMASIGGEVNAICRNGDTALHAAAETEYTENAELIISAGISVNAMNKKRRTPIFNSVYFNVTPMIDFLISKGADINHADIDKNTPLLIALKSDKPPALSFVKFLVSRKADVKLANKFGETAKSITNGRGLTEIEEYINTLL